MSNFRIYLPACNSYNEELSSSPIDILKRYVEQEFPGVNDIHAPCHVYSVPKVFTADHQEHQAYVSEETVFQKLKNVDVAGLWCVFFHGRIYGGTSFRNERNGKIMIREHDFVIFASYKGHRYMALVEVKSTCDDANANLQKVSDSKAIKNNKRSAQHQLRDHLEVIGKELQQGDGCGNEIQSYIFWPFLSPRTRDPQKNEIPRWKEDGKLHAFKDAFATQGKFNSWFSENILNSNIPMNDNDWMKMLQRFVILSCGVYVDELHEGLLALLTQEQLDLLHRPTLEDRPLIIHGAAGTGKTLLIIQKLKQLYQQGKLHENARALYICYWPGIRCDVSQKLDKLGIGKYVDTVRFYIALDGFLKHNRKKYRHIFMDESEAICLAFDVSIIRGTFDEIDRSYDLGCLWYLVDINQAAIFLPKHSPNILKTPDIVLQRVIRSTANIYKMFHQFYKDPFPLMPPAAKQMTYSKYESIANIEIGHDISGLPIYWCESENNLSFTATRVVVDLCTTKGIKPNDICMLPFFITNDFRQDSVNREIQKYFVENGFMPQALCNVESFLLKRENNHFLVPWALRAKGLEFKVVILVVADDDIDFNDSEDRRKLYIMSSRCTCLLILISSTFVKAQIDVDSTMLSYPFQQNF